MSLYVMFTIVAFSIHFFVDQCFALPSKGHSRRSFKVDRVRHGFEKRSATREARKAFQKFGIPMPTGLSSLRASKVQNVSSISSDARDQAGSKAQAPKLGDVEFLAPINIGGQQLMMNFDTGSSDLWVFSTLLPDAAKLGHTLFDPTKSRTFQELPGASFTVKFGDGSAAAGNLVGTDTVNIGGATATGQAVELATTVAESFVEDTASNGLVGLGFSKLNAVKPQPQKTFFDTIQSDLALPVLTASLRHEADGFYEFGKIDTTAFNGQLATTKVNPSRGFWEFESSQFQIGNGQVQKNRAGSNAIADTGTTLMLVDDEVAKAYYEQVQDANFDREQGLYVFPCDAQLPDFHVALGPNYMATIPRSILNFNQVSQHTCAGGLQSNQGGDLQIYGDIMFKSQFVVFNIRDETISFADHA